MKVFIAGIDGYLGWPLAQYLTGRGHVVSGIDNFARRQWVSNMDSQSAMPIYGMDERLAAFEARFGTAPRFYEGDLLDYALLRAALEETEPDAIVHLGEMPSAPYSMIDQARATYTQSNNVIGSLNVLWAMHEAAPHAHLVKLGTMGEYGTPNVDIPEGFFEVEFRGRKDVMPFPRQANSFCARPTSCRVWCSARRLTRWVMIRVCAVASTSIRRSARPSIVSLARP